MQTEHRTTKEEAEYLRLAEHTLANWRHQGIGPRYIKAGGKVLYPAADTEAWLAANAVEPRNGAGR